MKKILLIFAVASVMMLGSCNKNDIDLPQEEDQTLAGLKDGDIIPGQYVVLLNRMNEVSFIRIVSARRAGTKEQKPYSEKKS